MEVQRICDVIDKHLAGKTYMVGEEYTIAGKHFHFFFDPAPLLNRSFADIILFPWALQVRLGYKHPSGISARDFLSFDKYSNLNAWIDRINARPAVKRGLRVCNTAGHGKPWLVDGKGKM